MTRFGSGWGACLMLGSLLVGCGRVAREAKAPPAAPAQPINGELAFADDFAPTSYASHGTANAPAAVATSAAPPAPPANSLESAPQAEARELLDIEAHLGLLVASVSVARAQLRKLAAARAATVTNDISSDSEGQHEATLVIRVPSGANDAFMGEVERLGEVTAREIVAKDVGKEYHDSEILLHNLERTLARYEEILQKAQTVEEILKIELELSRIRGEVERVKGELRYLADRTSRATLFVSIHERGKPIAETHERVAKFFPGLRAVALTELRDSRKTVSAFGGGLVVGAGRSLNVELDALKRVDSGSAGFDAVLATIGGDTYSDFLGGGNRRFLNPYLGLRLGYARVSGVSDLAAGVTAGVELWKTQYATIDCDLRALGLFGKGGSELGLQPTLGANVAF
ncbi:MAG: DUF4349 domain-containing protein [Myxococcales bacterium]